MPKSQWTQQSYPPRKLLKRSFCIWNAKASSESTAPAVDSICTWLQTPSFATASEVRAILPNDQVRDAYNSRRRDERCGGARPTDVRARVRNEYWRNAAPLGISTKRCALPHVSRRAQWAGLRNDRHAEARKS